MQYIFTETVIHYEWMPDGIVKEIFDEYGHAHELHEGATFSIECVLEWAKEYGFDDYLFSLDDFMQDNKITKLTKVLWEW